VTTQGQFVDSSGNVSGTYTYGGEYVTGGWLSDINSSAAGGEKNFTRQRTTTETRSSPMGGFTPIGAAALPGILPATGTRWTHRTSLYTL
jgi:hypothetical protein